MDWITTQLCDEEKDKQATHQISAAGALVHSRVWYLAIAGLVHGAVHYALFFWMPQIAKTLASGYSNTTVGFMVMVPYLTGLVAMIVISRSSDRKLERRWHVAIPAMIAGLACVSMWAAHSIFSGVLLLSIAVGCVCGYLGPFWALPSEFLTGAAAASGIALITTFTNLGGFFGPYAFGLIRQKTGNFYAPLTAAGIIFFGFATLVLLLPRVSRGLVGVLPLPNREDQD
jgi:MFS transporter, ACS family, tartrate transporter